MAESKHTPGPWVVHEIWNGRGSSYSVGRAEVGSYHTLARVLQPHNGKTGDNAANACLIASAPEMADMIRDLLSLHEAHHNHPLHAAARLLLAKARGGLDA